LLTIRFDELGLQAGDLVLDAGAGFGRHAFEIARRGANIVALDYMADEVIQTRGTFGAMFVKFVFSVALTASRNSTSSSAGSVGFVTYVPN